MRCEMGTTGDELSTLPKYHFYARSGKQSFFLRGSPPLPEVSDDVVAQVRKQTAEQYGGAPVTLDEEFYRSIFPKDPGGNSYDSDAMV